MFGLLITFQKYFSGVESLSYFFPFPHPFSPISFLSFQLSFSDRITESAVMGSYFIFMFDDPGTILMQLRHALITLFQLRLAGWPGVFLRLFSFFPTVKRSRTRENNTTPEGYQPWWARVFVISAIKVRRFSGFFFMAPLLFQHDVNCPHDLFRLT